MCRILLSLVPVTLQHRMHLFLCFCVTGRPRRMAGYTGEELLQEMLGALLYFFSFFWPHLTVYRISVPFIRACSVISVMSDSL